MLVPFSLLGNADIPTYHIAQREAQVLEVIQWGSPPMSRYSVAPVCRWMLNMGSERAGGEPGSVRLWGHSGHQHWPLSAILRLTSREAGVRGETSRVTFVGTLSHRFRLTYFPKIRHYEARKYGPRSCLLWAHEHIQLWQPSDFQGQVNVCIIYYLCIMFKMLKLDCWPKNMFPCSM